jgi:hypothetical protein
VRSSAAKDILIAMEQLWTNVISWSALFDLPASKNSLRSKGEKRSMLLKDAATPEDPNVLLTIQNNRNPEQVIYVIVDDSREHLTTQGLQRFFGLKEIRLDTQNIGESIHEYAAVVSHILDTISTARDLNLPYRYQDEFTLGNIRYAFHEEGDYRVLRRVGFKERQLHT